MKKQKNATAIGFVFLGMVVFYLGLAFLIPLLSNWGIKLPVTIVLLLGEIPLMLPGIIYLCWNKVSIRDVGYRMPKIRTLLLSVVLGFLSIPIASLFNLISQLFVSNTVAQNSEVLLEGGAINVLLVSSVVAPIVEEFVCRGVLFHPIKRLSTPRKGILISAFCFGLIHLNFNQFLYAFALGIIFAVIVHVSKSIWTSIIVHFTINAVNMLMVMVAAKVYEGRGESLAQSAEVARANIVMLIMSIAIYSGISVVATILMILILRYIAKVEGTTGELTALLKKREKTVKSDDTEVLMDEEEKEPRVFLNVPMILGVIICIVIMVID